MTDVMNWAKETLSADAYKMCKEDMASDYPDLWRQWLDKYNNANRSKHNFTMNCTAEEYKLMLNTAPHGSFHRKIGIVTEARSLRVKSKMLIFSYIYNNEIYRTKTALRTGKNGE